MENGSMALVSHCTGGQDWLWGSGRREGGRAGYSRTVSIYLSFFSLIPSSIPSDNKQQGLCTAQHLYVCVLDVCFFRAMKCSMDSLKLARSWRPTGIPATKLSVKVSVHHNLVCCHELQYTLVSRLVGFNWKCVHLIAQS